MFAKIGYWLARGGAATFTVYGLYLFFFGRGFSRAFAIQCFIVAAIFYGVDQITAAIRESHQWWVDQESGESEEGDQ